MKRFLLASILVFAGLIGLGMVVRAKYVLDTQRLEAAIQIEIPPGTPKTKVLQFLQARKPVYLDDLGTHVKTRLAGRARNLIYRRDIVLDFEFDPTGRLMSYSKKEFLSFI